MEIKLRECPDCTHLISTTAIMCPICEWAAPAGEDIPNSNNIAIKAGKAGMVLASAAAIVAMGPAAITGGLASLLVPSGVKMKGVRKIAKQIGAIDIFRLSDHEMILVTRKSLWIVDGRSLKNEIPFEELKKAEIDGTKIKKKSLLRDASAVITLKHRNPKLFGKYYYPKIDYVNTGNDSLQIVKYALAKIRESVPI